MSAEERIAELKKTLEYHIDRYYNQDDPEITDYEYDHDDAGTEERLEKEHPELCHAGFSDTSVLEEVQNEKRVCLVAPQCSDVKSSGCFFQRGSI